ncbi:adenosylcobinamide-GDP ribazoletransferase [Geoglobus acetivorans]|nr:adenosylcobinamide-GDP ribazoletransferase [Geoglobus acetivorans]
MDALRAGLSFFTTLRMGGDFENLTNNLYLMPVIGAIIGVFAGVVGYPLFMLNLAMLAFIVYVGIEGINHIDGLADFFDSLFAPPEKKIKALKDLNIGTGGVIAVTSYAVFLIALFGQMDFKTYLLSMILGQILAKQGMLHLMLSEKPLWEGMVSEFTRNRKRRDWISYVLTLFFSGLMMLFDPLSVVVSLAVYAVLLVLFRGYVRGRYGGINGDMVGALNCLIFLAVVIVWALLRS